VHSLRVKRVTGKRVTQESPLHTLYRDISHMSLMCQKSLTYTLSTVTKESHPHTLYTTHLHALMSQHSLIYRLSRESPVSLVQRVSSTQCLQSLTVSTEPRPQRHETFVEPHLHRKKPSSRKGLLFGMFRFEEVGGRGGKEGGRLQGKRNETCVFVA